MAGSIRKSVQRSRARFIVRPLFAALVASGIVAPAQGATIVVSDGGDAGTGTTCTLRQAIASLNGGAAIDGCSNTGGSFGTNDLVDLAGRTGTIALVGATPLQVDVSMQIQGPGPAALTISGAKASRVFEVSLGATDFELAKLTVADGKSLGPGGCIYAQGYGGSPTTVFLSRSVVTGCKANDDPSFSGGPYNAIGGGVFAYALQSEYTTISGNTAQTAGGGVAARFVLMNQTLVTGNTVLGETVSVDTGSPPTKYLFPPVLGGGGILALGSANLSYSTVSNNTVTAARFVGTSDTGPVEYRIGTGGGITQLSLPKYTEPMLAPAGKSTIAGVRALLPPTTPGKAAELRARAAARWSSPVAKAAMAKPKSDGESGGLGLRNSTVSGNRVVGSGSFPNGTEVVAKYAGGGAAFYSFDYNAEFANSTVSGNLLPTGGICSPSSGPPPGNVLRATCGAGLAGDSAELSNTTVTGNVGATAVQFKYGIPVTTTLNPASVKSAALLDAHPRLKQALLSGQSWRAKAGASAKASMKAASAPELVSTIVAANNGTYDIGCLEGCTIGGGADLVGSAQYTVLLPGGTLGGNPQLAPLANRGGVAAGAPGILGTGPTPTHALYVGSPALDTGANIEGFSYDQRGPGFPRTVGLGTDIGAYEGSIKRPVTSIPALGPWMLGALSALLGALGLWRRRRRG